MVTPDPIYKSTDVKKTHQPESCWMASAELRSVSDYDAFEMMGEKDAKRSYGSF